ncbi:hypothetical protein Tco_0377550 [Tanacetum coccineum]
MLTDHIDWANPEGDQARIDISKPLPLSGPPGHVTIQTQFFFNKDLDYLCYGSKGSGQALLISKMKDARYHDFGLELLIPEHMWIDDVCTYDISASYGISYCVVRIKAYSRYGYDYLKEITLRRADHQEYTIAEKDFKNLYPSDFEDLNLLLLQGHLNHILGLDICMLSTAVKLWTRNLVIRQLVEDFQLGIESYQKQLNLTKPGWDAIGFDFKHDYTIIDLPHAVVFPVSNNERNIMRFNKIYKFSDVDIEKVAVRSSLRSLKPKRTIESRAKRSSINLIRTLFHITCSSHNVKTRVIIRVLRIILVVLPEHPSDTYVFTMKMEILLEPTSNKLMVGKLGDSDVYTLEDPTLILEILSRRFFLRLNLPDHRSVLTGSGGLITYTSISSDSNGPSWGIPLVNASELPEMDPYEEVAQPGQTLQLSSAYVPDPMELDEHVSVYVLEPEHPEYHVPSDDDIQSMEEDSIDYPNEPEDDVEDPEEDPEEDHTDYPVDGDDGDDEPSDADTDDEDEEPTKDEEEEEHLAPADPSAIPIVDLLPQLGIQRHLRLMSLHLHLDHLRLGFLFLRHISVGHRRLAAMIRMIDDIPKEDMPPRRRFVLTAPPPGCEVAESFANAAARPPTVADRGEDVGYVRALQASEHRMMTSIEEVNFRVSYQAQVRRQESKDFYTQLHDARTDHKDIRLEIDVVRGQRTAYETKLREVRQGYLRIEARNRALLARIETPETHMSRMKWQRQSVEDLVCNTPKLGRSGIRISGACYFSDQ